ncbi:hypothetical protein [Inquilinus limosus]|uniref:Uncharacterized protein n=1 Tax=Inquilinus limosus TaxID=171674 RepID=A0A211ZER3_9PROT|nr:hypothetical protein [Inquilinus limosus]OWJ63788.1 hypothetical protein BWR60_27950 [Inquilinus limosus]
MNARHWIKLLGLMAALAASPALAQTAIPAAPVAASATVDRDKLPAAGQHDTLLRVLQPGRFSIRVSSPSGVAIQLVDMLTGPSEPSGEAGVADGRLDVLLDIGTYKLRLFGAKGAEGEAALTVAPFREAEAPALRPRDGEVQSAPLADLQQRSFWLAVEVPGFLRLEAAGRSLADLRFWRNGTDLVPQAGRKRTIEPVAGHPMTDVVFEGNLEPGTYLVTAYGGPAATWADGDTSQPFHIRFGASDALLAGWAGGTIGPFGRDLYRIDGGARLFRLALPGSVPAGLRVLDGTSPVSGGTIDRKSREPATSASAAASDSPGDRVVELTGAASQAFQLRAIETPASTSVSNPGDWWVAAPTAGFGGDELPATLALLRTEKDKPTVTLGSNAPQVGPGAAWRQRFNLRGPSTLLLHVTADGPIALRSEGPAIRPTMTVPSGGAQAARTGGATPSWDLAAGWYVLKLEPIDGASGILDLTVGPPGLVPRDNAPIQPADPVVGFGRQALAEGQALRLVANSGPQARTGLSARRWPLDLADGPLAVTQGAGEPLSLSLSHPADGTLLQTEVGVGTTALKPGPAPASATGADLTLPAPDKPRTVILSWQPPAAPLPDPAVTPPPPLTALQAGRPAWFDLDRDAERSFALTVADGGLYRVETLGRLRTSGSIGTAFIDSLGDASANGAGQNMLLQHYLRAGRYRVTAKAEDGAGRLGLTARPTPMLPGAALVPAGTVRAALPAGSGILFPVEIPADGTYRLEILGLDRSFTARLEDSEGWPLLAAGDLSGTEQELAAGRYRLMILPEAVDTRVVARLTRIEPEVALEDHGPHPLPFDADQTFQWREPAGREDPRTPDQWDFTLAGPAKASLSLSDGMVAELRRLDTPDAAPVARFSGSAGFEGALPAGQYRVEATSLGRNDRLDYTLSLHTDELQLDTVREITLPATVPFSIATDRVVSLTSFGGIDVKAVLRDAQGQVLGRFDDRDGDWNIAASQYLPAGRYTLELARVEAATTSSSGDDSSDNSDELEDSGDGSGPTTELWLSLPAEDSAAATAQPSGTVELTGPTVHRLVMPAATAGSLMVAAANSSAELMLALERQGADGSWASVAIDRGLAPAVAVPADGDASRPWRASVWTVDGGGQPVRFAARLVEAEPQQPGAVALSPLALDGLPQTLATTLVAAPGAGLERVDGADLDGGLWQGSAPGQALRPLTAPVLAPQSDRLWLLGRTAPPARLTLAPLAADPSRPTILDLATGEAATLPPPTAQPGRLRAWLARSGDGQPGLDAGLGMGVASGDAFALGASTTPLTIRNAGGAGALRLELTGLDLALAAERRADSDLSDTLAPGSALPVTLPAGAKRLRLDLPAGVAIIAGWRGPDAETAWAGDAPASWSLDGAWTDLLLVNTGTRPAPVSLAQIPDPSPAPALAIDRVLKRFFGAEGTVLLRLPAGTGPGHRLIVAGAADATVIGRDGHVASGRRIQLTGPGLVVLRHDAGLVAAWMESAEYGPWPQPELQDAPLPGILPLAGEAMTLRVQSPQPALLTARTTAPVILAADGDAPELFPAGAEFHRYLQDASLLHLFSPQDGPLSGSIELVSTPIAPLAEGVGDPVTVASGGTALFGFTVEKDSDIGIGIRAEPDRARVRLLDADGKPLGDGVVQMRHLAPGRYLIEAQVPPDAPATLVRPAVVGITARPSGPPEDVIRGYLDLAGLAPATNARGK